MKHKTLLFIAVLSAAAVFFTGLFTGIFAGQAAAEETVAYLEKKLETASGKEKIELLNQLANKNVSFSPQKSIDFGNRALELARESGDRNQEAKALGNMGTAYRVLDKYPEAVEYHKRALLIFEELGDRKSIAMQLRHRAIDYWSMSNYSKALADLERALILFEELDIKIGIASSLNIIGVINDDLTNLDTALEYYLRAMKIYEEIDDKTGIALSLGNVGVIYRKLQRFDKALEFQKKALAINEARGDKEGIARDLTNIGVALESKEQYREALDYYLRSLKIKRELGNKRNIFPSLGNIANTYTFLGEYDKAAEYYMESLKINEESGHKRGIALCLSDLGNFYLTQHKYSEAMTHFNRALVIAKEIAENSVLNDVYFYMAGLYTEKGDYKQALEYLKLYSAVHDEIVNKASNDKIAELQTIYETEKKEKEIDLLEKNNQLLKKNSEIQDLRVGRERFKANAFIAGLILVFIIAALLFKKYVYLFSFWKRKSYIGHYRLLGEIGSGGMGIVYKASPVMEKDKTVALKVIRDEYSKDAVYRKRFLNEAHMVDQLDHPNIVKVFERGESDERLFIAMEMLNGRSIAEILRAGEIIPLIHCISIMYQVVDAVIKIHSRGIVHRDLKPENIMIVDTEEGEPHAKLLDFGLAKSMSLTRLTETGEILGTINYLPPERIAGREFTDAGDIYSLGVVFYEMLTVEKPFSGDTPIDIIKEIMEKEPAEPSRSRPGIPADLDSLVMEMMSKEPGGRPPEKLVLGRIDDLRQGVAI